MRIVLHIGAAKTGSSALQAAFVRNRDALSERGVYYPPDPYEHLLEKGRVLSGNALSLAAHMTPNLLERPLWRNIPAWSLSAFDADLKEAARRKCEILLYSSEYLCSAKEEKIAGALAELANYGDRPEVIYLVRNLSSHAVSSYNQNSRQGRFSGTLEEYIADTYRPRFSRQAKKWASKFSRDPSAFRVLHYDGIDDRLFHAFVESLGVSSDGLPEAEVLNASKSAPAINIPHEVRQRWENEAALINDLYRPTPTKLSV